MADADPAATRPGFIARYWTGIALWKRIFAALVLGAVAGLLFGEAMQALGWIGALFVRLIRMLVAPLVFIVIVAGLNAVGDPRRLGSIGRRAVLLYLGTTVAAISIGLALALALAPGVGVVLGAPIDMPQMESKSATDMLIEIVPVNPVDALARTQMLSIIFTAILIGVGLVLVGERAKPLADVFDAASAVFIKLIQLVMELAPFGVFALIAVAVGNNGISAFMSIFWIGLALLIGCLLQMALVHGALVRFAAGLSPSRFFRNITEAMLMGFSTASSSATLPVSLQVAERRLGVSRPIAAAVLPLGATVSMDGTALYIGILAVFGAQAFGIPLGPYELLMIAFATIAVSVGAAPVPGSSLFLVAGVLATFGLGAEQAAMVVAFVLPFDRPLDMIRTVPNIASDLAVSTVVAVKEGEFDAAVFHGEKPAG